VPLALCSWDCLLDSMNQCVDSQHHPETLRYLRTNRARAQIFACIRHSRPLHAEGDNAGVDQCRTVFEELQQLKFKKEKAKKEEGPSAPAIEDTEGLLAPDAPEAEVSQGSFLHVVEEERIAGALCDHNQHTFEGT
jgi:hypothetical protein